MHCIKRVWSFEEEKTTCSLLTACSTPYSFDRIAKQSTGCMGAIKEFMHISGMAYGGSATFAGTRNKNKVPPCGKGDT